MKRKLGKFEMAQTLSSEYAPFNAVGILRLKNGPSQIYCYSYNRGCIIY